MVQLQLGGCIFHQRRPPKSARDCSTVHNTSFYQHNIVQIHRFNPTCPQHELNLGSILAKKKPLTWAQLMKRCCKCLSLPFLWKILAKANWQCSWEQRPLEGNQNISRSCVLCQSPLPRHIRVPNHLKRGRESQAGEANPEPLTRRFYRTFIGEKETVRMVEPFRFHVMFRRNLQATSDWNSLQCRAAVQSDGEDIARS